MTAVSLAGGAALAVGLVSFGLVALRSRRGARAGPAGRGDGIQGGLLAGSGRQTGIQLGGG